MIAFLLTLTGCTVQEEVEVVDNNKFTVTKKQSAVYNSKIKTCLDNYYWRYDKNILYSEKTLEDNEAFVGISVASKELEMSLENLKNETVVEAQATLLYYNNEVAGTGHFYFKGNDIVGAYYNNNFDEASIFSLRDRNIFTSKVSFKGYEDVSMVGVFDAPKDIKENMSGINAIGVDSNNNTVIAVIEDSSVKIYHYKNKYFYLKTRLDFSSTNMVPSDILIFKQTNTLQLQYAVLLDSVIPANEDSDVTMKSEKVVFYNENMTKSYNDIILEKDDYLTMGYDDQEIVLFGGSNMEYYKLEGSTWGRYSQILLEHEVQSFIKEDIDGDDKYEYIMMNGKDMFVYHKENKFLTNIWKTHISSENLQGNLFVSDLNLDGTKEIYVLDSTGTTIRYILNQKGFVSQNEDILYGDQIYPGDFNNDGKPDYIKLNMQDNTMRKLYIKQ